jgi:DNA polymerase III subunit beta
MKFQIPRSEMLKGLQAVIGVVERRQTMPILSNLLLRADKQGLMLAGTDLELELVTRVPASVKQEGATTVPARKLFDICRGLPEDAEIKCELKEQRLTLSSSRSRFILSTLSADDFPFLEEVKDAKSISVPRPALKQLLDRTHFAMAHQDVRYYLNGLLLVVRKDRMRAVATDGHRLALCDATGSLPVNEEIQVIVPRKAITELQRLLDGGEEPARLAFTPNHLQITLGETRFTTKLVDGRFPDYEKVIPAAGDKRLTGQREAVRQALARTAILSNEKFRGVRLSLKDSKLKLQAQNPEHEEAEEELEVEYEGAPIEIGFNVTYLMDALGGLEGESFTLDLTGPDASGLIKEKGTDACQYVVMPMRL